MKTYHDYVIKDGQFIGEFNEMYRAFDDPWMQKNQPNKYSRMAGIYHLKNFGISSVVEWGCGLGYYADWIHRDTGIVCKSLDVAPAAIEKAKPLFPHLDFEVAGIGADFEKYTDYDCILFAEIVWYILPQLRQIVQQLQTHCRG